MLDYQIIALIQRRIKSHFNKITTCFKKTQNTHNLNNNVIYFWCKSGMIDPCFCLVWTVLDNNFPYNKWFTLIRYNNQKTDSTSFRWTNTFKTKQLQNQIQLIASFEPCVNNVFLKYFVYSKRFCKLQLIYLIQSIIYSVPMSLFVKTCGRYIHV